MMVNDFHVLRAFGSPHEAYPPLIVSKKYM